MTTKELSEMVREFLSGSLNRYHQDLEAIPEEKFALAPDGSARSAADFTVEVTGLNERFAQVLRKQDPGTHKWDGWPRAKGDAAQKSTSCEKFKKSADELLAAYDELGEDGLEGDVQGFGGPVAAYKLAHFAAVHITYHDGQLNYIQALCGDEAVHWS